MIAASLFALDGGLCSVEGEGEGEGEPCEAEHGWEMRPGGAVSSVIVAAMVLERRAVAGEADAGL